MTENLINIGVYNTLTVLRFVDFGAYLDDGAEGILLPKRFMPANLAVGDAIKVFLYHDSDNRIIATTQEPYGIVDDVVQLKCVDVTPQGAFLDWGLMKDIFVPKSQQLTGMHIGGQYLVRIYIDKQTGRVAATEKINAQFSNEVLTVKEMELVDLVVQRRSDLGYVVIINNKHIGLIHFSAVFKDLKPGDKLTGYIKTIRPDNKIDVMPGKPGYQRVEEETDKIIRLLKEHNGYLPFHDKSDPEEIYTFFGMSKKVFKMTIGTLYKQQKIAFAKAGIQLTQED
ncbi:CvfB family protein [Limnovirga soli]|uniref:RNA-binding protein n=1 Tax=Limnovirga soli TaxID=2656915 RepID=A0A8J8JQ81_9BACT|nr:S1-like domain-containing RNA-binding protein [Limnovirga soli]NNV54437.1 RNA-binding protein [Limnovirga soli]